MNNGSTDSSRESMCQSQTVLRSLMDELTKLQVTNVTLSLPPDGCEDNYQSVLTPGAVQFVAKLCQKFFMDVHAMLTGRAEMKQTLDSTEKIPEFLVNSGCRDDDWKVAPPPRRLQCRHIDLGDVSPSNTKHFVAALNSSAQGIQVDFDDGHCPIWRNQLLGLDNINRVVHNKLDGVPRISEAPVLMIRPRAWNMVETNMLVDGKAVAGPLFDFGLLMYHNGKTLADCESGPYFYLPKLEGSGEAELWNRIFCWAEQQLGLAPNSTKACVLIENVLAAFQMDEILFELRDRSAGLNCGLLDYSASFLNKFGKRKEFLLPDRNQCLSMDQHFLKSYRDLLIKTCHRRGAYATGGMAALLLPADEGGHHYQETLEKVKSMKGRELEAGVDGFLVYDLGLVQPMQKLFQERHIGSNQLHVVRDDVTVETSDLLKMPKGSITHEGLRHNIKVGVLFIEAWLRGQGCFILNGVVEDSATAEISRLQVWQWLFHQSELEGGGNVTMEVVRALAEDIVEELSKTGDPAHEYGERLHIATEIFMDIITKEDFVEFITDYLYAIVSVMS